MNSSMGNPAPMGCRAEVMLQLSRGSAVRDTGPVEPGGQHWEAGDTQAPFCSLWAAQTELVSVKCSLSCSSCLLFRSYVGAGVLFPRSARTWTAEG